MVKLVKETLSDKREKIYTGDTIKGCREWYYKYPDWAVKQFIKDLKNELMFPVQDGKMGEMLDEFNSDMFDKIDKLAGDKLI